MAFLSLPKFPLKRLLAPGLVIDKQMGYEDDYLKGHNIERNIEKDVVQKSEDQPKLFYKYINGKMKNKKTIERIVKEGRHIKQQRK
ncbi:hypothetical protein E2C01_030204 [Portunus trituberculatus]|uniref:Uncharacterized protein n=1 Tax=Portunus trituberculatus TaxID=210409 RepID=A0A5B7EU44_PORTR|nr:hypothetical protein [Portunus trituberculatus]